MKNFILLAIAENFLYFPYYDSLIFFWGGGIGIDNRPQTCDFIEMGND